MALARWQATIQDALGNVMPGATVSVRLEATGALVPCFSDRDGLVSKGNPFTAGTDGHAFFHAPGGAYRIKASLGGQEIEWRWVGVGLGAEIDLSILPLGEDVPQVDDLTARAAYNGEDEGFRIIVSDVGDGRAALYTMGGGGSGDWSDPAYLTGVGINGAPGSSDVVGTSTSSVAIGTGSKTFTVVQSDRGWGVGARLRASSNANGANFMEGVVASYSGNTLQVTVGLVGGSGTHADWTINLAGQFGTPGTNGVDGADPGILLTWDTGTSDANPGSGIIRANNASLASATVLFVSKTNRAGSSIATFLLGLADSTNTVKGHAVITNPVTDAQAILNVTGVTDATGYVKVAVASHSGATSFADDIAVSFQFSRAGNVGAAGAGSGDMQAATYDPTSKAADAFAMGNMVEGTTNKIFTATERTKLSGIETAADVTDAGNVGSTIHAATGKATPVDADTVALIDSAASNVLKKVTWANIKATLKTYFDTLYQAAGSYLTSAAIGSTVQAYDAQLSSLVRQNSQSAAYTLVLSDGGKQIYHPPADTTARIWTIPANSSVAFPIGTVVTFDNDIGAGAITIAITTDTLVHVGPGTTGSRTLASGGQATAIKVAATRWRISGGGLT